MKYGDAEFLAAVAKTRDAFKRTWRSAGVSLPARRIPRNDHEYHTPWPSPIIPARTMEDYSEAPNALRALIARAEKRGWGVLVTYAYGTGSLKSLEEHPELGLTPGGKVRRLETGPPKLVASWAMRATKGTSKVVAVYEDGSYTHGIVILNGVYDYTKRKKGDIEDALEHE